jgi:hypothetical protein
MTLKRLLSFFLSFISLYLFPQEIKKGPVYDYARMIVDTMASESMHGRGYVNNGDAIAANYLKTEFEKLHLKPFNGDLNQKFNFSINTFPYDVKVKCDDRELKAGSDYIVYAHSPSVSGTYDVLYADDKLTEQKKKLKKFCKQKFSDKILVLNDTGKQTKVLKDMLGNNYKAKAIVSLKDKLTWSMAQETSDYAIIEVLRSSYQSSKKISVEIENKFLPDYSTQNVIGYIEGSKFKDSFIVFSAHYDHLGQMGKDVYFPGANDNASGCAMLLNLAKYYSMPAHRPKYSIAFIAFAGEEVGLLGSKYYTEHPLFPLENIKFLLNMDIMGTGEDGITVVNGSVFKKEFDDLKRINEENKLIADVKIRGKAANSDHYFFSENGVKAFFIYTMGGIKAYHDIYDRPETLPLNEFEDLFNLIVKFGDQLQRNQ